MEEDMREALRSMVERMAWKCAYQETHTHGELRDAWRAGYEAMYHLYQLLSLPPDNP